MNLIFLKKSSDFFFFFFLINIVCAWELRMLPACLEDPSKQAGRYRGIKNASSGTVILLGSMMYE